MQFHAPDDGLHPGGVGRFEVVNLGREGIVRDMRAHLERRKTNADADVIRSNRGPIMQAILGFHDFVKSKALGNVFRSLGLFLGAWLWYVFNTQLRQVRSGRGPPSHMPEETPAWQCAPCLGQPSLDGAVELACLAHPHALTTLACSSTQEHVPAARV